ncbi:hypothetical protein THOM_0581, partial [Trachipleistophora hominis]
VPNSSALSYTILYSLVVPSRVYDRRMPFSLEEYFRMHGESVRVTCCCMFVGGDGIVKEMSVLRNIIDEYFTEYHGVKYFSIYRVG